MTSFRGLDSTMYTRIPSKIQSAN